MRKIFFTALFCILATSIFSQITYIDDDAPDRDTTELESLPWFGNNQYLENFLDSIGYPSASNRIVGLDRVRYRVPIKFWVYRRTNGTGGATMENIRDYMNNLNRVYNVDNNTWIGFYMKCDVTVINDDSWFDIGGDGEAWNLVQNRKEKGCINIHIVGDYEGVAGVHIRARVFGRDGIVMNWAATNGGTNTTIAHEVGHYFELDHTHQYSNRGKCRKEAIDRNRTWPWIMFCPFGGGGPSSQRICEATGDLLRDTPADPDLSSNRFNVTGTCTLNDQGDYTNARDPWDDSYVNPPAGSLIPDTRNVMSYNRDRDCRIIFSRLQIAVMLYSIERGKSKNNKPGWNATRTVYDDYEMDNFAVTARPILINEVQERNFHQQYNEDLNSNPVWTNCDVDWLRFTPTCGGTFDIETFYFAGTISPDTRLTLFADDGVTQLAQNDDISATNKFSKITYAFTAATTYRIRVENLNPVLVDYNNSYYKISIGGARITGVNEFCGSSTFTLDVPTGATVTWSISPSPNNIVNSSVSGNTITLTQKPIGSNPRIANSGNITITANYSHPCLGNGTATKTVFVGTKTPTYGLYAPDGYCPGNSFEAIASSNNTGSVTYDWYINGVLNSYHWYKLRGTFTSSTGTYIGVQVRKTGCGISQEYYQFWPCGGQFRVSPNPATSTLKIESDVEFEKIRLVDKAGNVKREWTVSKGTKETTIDISSFNTDIYNIVIFDGQRWIGKVVSKQ